MRDAIVLDKVSKRYGKGPFIVDGLSHTFAPATATGLTGPNGSGKTTILRLLGVTTFPSGGHVYFGQTDIHQAPYMYLQQVGIVHDAEGLPQYLSAEELLQYIYRARRQWTPEANGEIAAMLDQVLLDERRSQLISTYSTGMLKKTQIAAAMIGKPSVLLLDEPLRGLDENARQNVIELFKAFRDNQGILIMASHQKEALSSICDSLIDLKAFTTYA